uniref:Putative secreted protein n=1 Tax=Amblyomma triste TaxID=251400 RepID=A0A023G1Y8_AMBTT
MTIIKSLSFLLFCITCIQALRNSSEESSIPAEGTVEAPATKPADNEEQGVNHKPCQNYPVITACYESDVFPWYYNPDQHACFRSESNKCGFSNNTFQSQEECETQCKTPASAERKRSHLNPFAPV